MELLEVETLVLTFSQSTSTLGRIELTVPAVYGPHCGQKTGPAPPPKAAAAAKPAATAPSS